MKAAPERLAEGQPAPTTEACPGCGTPGSVGSQGAGCPVCLLREALRFERTDTGGQRDVGPAVSEDDGRYEHYALVRGADGNFEELGRGAMGITYRALDTVLGHSVALKVLNLRVAAHLPARQRFFREARAAAQLRHSHVASVFFYGVRQSDGQCFYAMELVEGETLEARILRTGPLPVPVALTVVAQVTRALEAAEAQGMVHRDLKPANLMLAHGPELSVKVIDFGLAKAALAGDDAELTQGGFVGTPAFASPEQCTGARVDVRADLYSLGITLWQMLTGQTPFRGSWSEVMHHHAHAPLPLDRLQGVPQPMVVLLRVMLEKDPACRFQNPTQLLQALPVVTAAVNARRTLVPHDIQPASPPGHTGMTRIPPVLPRPDKISLARLPVTGSDLFGREEDLAFLDAAWDNSQLNVVTIVAWAGVGKSTLVNHWLRRLAATGYRSAELVFGWSFYRQGTGEGVASSADEFLDAALAWFGDADPRLGTPWEKGERLASVIAHRRALVVLDGLEPLQNPPGSQEGRLREPSLQAFLRELAAFNQGLCVITTRMAVADLAEYEGGSARRRELDHLTAEAGGQLLQALGVKGPEAELRTASDEFRGHSLALTLLGSYLTDAYEGDIRCRKEVSNCLAHDVRQGAHARKVMASYQSWWGEGPELSVLRLLGLFDRPADEQALGALFKPPAIPGLTEALTGLSPAGWRTVLARLRRAKLLAGEDPYHPRQLDAHPLVRQYFGGQLRDARKDAWQEANRRLYHHYRALAPPMPDRFREMEPLFLAVACGCQAGWLRDALRDVYLLRIQRGNVAFAANVLGARGALLSALAHFFEPERWGSVVQTAVEGQTLSDDDQLFILLQAAMYLTATRGFAAPEARLCYERAEPLCRSLGRPVSLNSALIGGWRYSLMTEKLTATMQVARRVYSLAREQKDAGLMIGAYRALSVPLFFYGDFETARQYATRGIQVWRSGGAPASAEEVNPPVLACLCMEALSRWHLDEVGTSDAMNAEAIAVARELKDMHGLAEALFFSALLGHFERQPAPVERFASELIELSARYHFAFWLAGGAIFRGWARSASGHTAEGLSWIEAGVADWRATGSILGMPFFLALAAEAFYLANRTSKAMEVIEDAQVWAERSEERWWCAELHRFRGTFLISMGAEQIEVEAAFRKATHTAEQQKSLSLLKRAEASCAEYCRRKGKKPGKRETEKDL